MRPFLRLLDRRLGLRVIILSFWALFFALNGADEFFNGGAAPNLAVTSGVVVDEAGKALHRIHPLQPIGWYGVSNAPLYVSRFDQLGMPAWAALGALYGLSLAQLLVAALFLRLLARTLKGEPPTAGRGPYHLAFVAAVLVFALLCVGDVLFGERAALWQHGTYIALLLVTYELWFDAERYFMARGVLEPR